MDATSLWATFLVPFLGDTIFEPPSMVK